MTFLQRIVINTISFIAIAGLMQNMQIFYVANIGTAIFAAIVLAILNAVLKPILVIISLPITIMTLGIFSVVINAFLLSLTSSFIGKESFSFSSFGATMLIAVLLSLINAVVSNYIIRKD